MLPYKYILLLWRKIHLLWRNEELTVMLMKIYIQFELDSGNQILLLPYKMISAETIICEVCGFDSTLKLFSSAMNIYFS